MTPNIPKDAHQWAIKLGKLPGVAAIFLSGSIAQGRSTQTSDIDFFIITYPGRIWSARFWVFMRLKIARNLAKPPSQVGKICPNHFVTFDRLEIQEKDDYAAHLFSHNIPLFDPLGIFYHFSKANQWTNSQFSYPFIHNSKQKSSLPLAKPKNIFEKIIGFLQTQKINKAKLPPNAQVILSDQELRFHPNPKNQYWKPQKKTH